MAHPHLHSQQHSQQQRPSSSADVCTGLHWPSGGRPTSAMDGRYSDTLRSSRIATPSDLLNTSVKSVFDCEQGCFVPSEEALLDETLDSEFLLNESGDRNTGGGNNSEHPRDV